MQWKGMLCYNMFHYTALCCACAAIAAAACVAHRKSPEKKSTTPSSSFAPSSAALSGASSKVKLTIGACAGIACGATRKCRASRLLTRPLSADHTIAFPVT